MEEYKSFYEEYQEGFFPLKLIEKWLLGENDI